MTTENLVPTTLALLNPRTDAVFVALGDQVMGLVRYAETRIIATDDDVKLATDDLGMIASLKKAVEDKRVGYVKPFNDHVKEVNGIFKLLSDPLEQADKINRKKVMEFRAEQERRCKEAEAINQAKLDLARREAELSGTGEITVDTTPVVVPQAPPQHVRAETASMGTQKVRKWEVTDIKLVPDEYKIIDTARVGKIVRAGVPSIPGIRIWEEDTLRITR